MKVAILIATFVLYSVPRLLAQKHEFGIHEYGLTLSNSFYKGSLSQVPTYSDFNPCVTFFYRHNFNPVWVARTQLSYTSLSYSDKDWSTPIANVRQTSFATDIFEVGEVFEYNFFDYRGENKRITWSPYLAAGLSGFLYKASSNSELLYGLALPIGFGLKSNLGKQWNIGFEFLARKTLTDELDSVSGLTNVNKIQAGDVSRTDWFYTLGLTISYTKYSVNCPKY